MRTPSLTEGSISRGLAQFALPILFANVLQSLNTSVNSIWVGRGLGEAALTATSNANTVMFLLIGAAFGVSMAATILVGQHIGARDLAEAKRTVGTATSFFAGISILMAAAGIILTEPMLVAMHTPPESMALAEAYMRVIFLGVPFLYMYAFVQSVLRGGGDSKTPFYFMLCSVAIDIGLNPVFIFGLGPAPRLGIAGSALATVLSQAVTLTALIVYLYRSRHPLVLRRNELSLLKLDGPIVRALVIKGIPMSAQMLVLSLSGILMIALVNQFGVDTAAAYGAALQLWNYIMMPAIAVGMAVSSFAAQNVGARKWDRVHTIAGIGVLYSVVLTGTVIAVIELVDRHAFAIFLPATSAAMSAASHMNHVVTWSYVFFGVTMVLFGVVRATGAVMMPLLLLIICLLGVRFPLAEMFLPTYHVDAIWWSFPISSALSSVLAVLYYNYGGWRTARMLAPAQEPVPEPSSEAPGA